jgi:hypothetical protein
VFPSSSPSLSRPARQHDWPVESPALRADHDAPESLSIRTIAGYPWDGGFLASHVLSWHDTTEATHGSSGFSCTRCHQVIRSGPGRFDALRASHRRSTKGESVAIVGKGTRQSPRSLRLLALLDRPSSGSIEARGIGCRASHHQHHPKPHLRLRLPAVLPHRRRIGARECDPSRSRSRASARASANGAVSKGHWPRWRREDKATIKASNLSGGQKQRAVITPGAGQQSTSSSLMSRRAT